jgi:hypothetical protein
LAHIRESRKRVLAEAKRYRAKLQHAAGLLQSATDDCCNLQQGVLQSATGAVAKRNTDCCKAQQALLQSATVAHKRSARASEREGESIESMARGDKSTPTPLPPDDSLPGHNPLLLTEQEQAEVEQASKLAESNAYFPMLGLGLMIGREPKPVPGMATSWWLPALERMRSRDRSSWCWPYLVGILRGFKRQGGPPPEVAAVGLSGRGDDAAPLPMSRVQRQRAEWLAQLEQVKQREMAKLKIAGA